MPHAPLTPSFSAVFATLIIAADADAAIFSPLMIISLTPPPHRRQTFHFAYAAAADITII
jgi:hypothetical protein